MRKPPQRPKRPAKIHVEAAVAHDRAAVAHIAAASARDAADAAVELGSVHGTLRLADGTWREREEVSAADAEDLIYFAKVAAAGRDLFADALLAPSGAATDVWVC